MKISVKASSVALMIAAYRLASETFDHPLHLGVTEAGPPAGRPGQGHRRHRHAPRRGDRRHHPLLADRRSGRGGPGRTPAARVPGPARAQGPRPHRLPVVRPGPGRRDRRGQGGPGGTREVEPAHPGRRHGLRGQRAGRGPGGRHRHRGRQAEGPPLHPGQDHPGRARGRHGAGSGRGGRATGRRGGRGAHGRGRRRPPRPRPRPTAASPWRRRGPIPTTPRRRSRSSAAGTS